MNEVSTVSIAEQKWVSSVLRCMPQPVFITNADGIIQFFNPAAERLTGYELEEAQGKPFEEIIKLVEKDTEAPVEGAISRTVREGRTEDKEFLLIRSTGSKVPVERKSVVLRNEDQAFSGVLVSLEDIRQRKKAGEAATVAVAPQSSEELEALKVSLREIEGKYRQVQETLQRTQEEHQKEAEALRRSREWFRSMVEDSSPIPWRMDADTLRLIYVGPRALEVLGFSPEKWLEENFWQGRVYAEDRDEVLKKFMELRGVEGNHEQEFRMLNEKEETVWVRTIISSSRKRDGNGEGRVLYGFMFDITEAKKLEDRLRQIQRLETAERLALGVANDFNNMLGAIESCVESLWFVYESDLTGRNYLHQIKTALLRAKTLTRQLQAFNSSYAAQMSPVNLSKVMNNLESLLKIKIPEGVSMEWQKSSSDFWVEGDSNQLSQLFINLFLYTVDAAKPAGNVSFRLVPTHIDEAIANRLAVDVRGPYVVLTVESNSQGEETFSPQFFEPYYAREGSSRKLGLELAAIYGIVRKHQGFIQCETLTENASRLEVFLPQIQVSAPAQAEEEVPKQLVLETWLPPSEPLTVMLVDNEALVRQGLKRILERNGFSVLEASSGEEALKMMQGYTGKIDLLITDMVMPGMPARELCGKIRKIQPAAKALIVSGLAASDAKNQNPDEEPVPFLQKPFSSDELMARIAEILPQEKVKA